MRRALVVSPVHPPDDPRIARKLIPSLTADWRVTYACREPGPSRADGFDYRPLRGGRVRRSLTATRLLLGRSYDVASVHDPELIPAVIVASLLHRTVVFDLHEDLPAQMRTRWQGWTGRVAGRIALVMLRLAARVAPLTLAEPGYATLFDRPPPVFENFPRAIRTEPRPADAGSGLVYLGDVTSARGVDLAVEAMASHPDLALDLIGRCRGEFAATLRDLARKASIEIRFHGFRPLEEALELAAGGVAGLSPLRDTANYRHSLPTKVLEYLSIGLPVIASDLPGTRAAIGDLPGVVLFEPGDRASLARAIERVRADDRMRDEAAAGADRVRAAFRWPGEAVARFYREVAG